MVICYHSYQYIQIQIQIYVIQYMLYTVLITYCIYSYPGNYRSIRQRTLFFYVFFYFGLFQPLKLFFFILLFFSPFFFAGFIRRSKAKKFCGNNKIHNTYTRIYIYIYIKRVGNFIKTENDVGKFTQRFNIIFIN